MGDVASASASVTGAWPTDATKPSIPAVLTLEGPRVGDAVRSFLTGGGSDMTIPGPGAAVLILPSGCLKFWRVHPYSGGERAGGRRGGRWWPSVGIDDSGPWKWPWPVDRGRSGSHGPVGPVDNPIAGVRLCQPASGRWTVDGAGCNAESV